MSPSAKVSCEREGVGGLTGSLGADEHKEKRTGAKKKPTATATKISEAGDTWRENPLKKLSGFSKRSSHRCEVGMRLRRFGGTAACGDRMGGARGVKGGEGDTHSLFKCGVVGLLEKAHSGGM